MTVFRRIFFLFFGLLALTALIGEFLASDNLVNYFSFFTILSNIFISLLFFYCGLTRQKYSSTMYFLLGAALVYMIVNALGYWVFLRDVPVERQWTNIILHLAMPLATLTGWLILPHLTPMRYTNALLWMLFPLFYIIYTLLRGPIALWYPYDFLDPVQQGYLGVFGYIVLFTLLIFVSGLGVVWTANHLAAKLTK